MESTQFITSAKESIDWIADYLEGLENRKVLPSVSKGYLHSQLPSTAPHEPDTWEAVQRDFQCLVSEGVTHWQSPHFHANHSSGSSYSSIVAELISAGISTLGISWMSSPVHTELEVIMMDWFAKLLNLPKHFQCRTDGPGGGIIQNSATESTFLCLVAARNKTLTKVKQQNSELHDHHRRAKIVAYASDQASEYEYKSTQLADVKLKLVQTDELGRLDQRALENAVQEDLKLGLYPAFLFATLGTYATSAFDNLEELSVVCTKYGLWLHVNSAYAGGTLMCPEYSGSLHALDMADSFVCDPHKTLPILFDCCALWVRNRYDLLKAYSVERIYLTHQKEGNPHAPDYWNWEIPLGRRFRALKLWIVFRTYGLKGLQEYVRNRFQLANQMKHNFETDDRFQVLDNNNMGQFCFRLKGEDDLTEKLLSVLTESKLIYLSLVRFKGKSFIRYVIANSSCQQTHLESEWEEIKAQASLLLTEEQYKLI